MSEPISQPDAEQYRRQLQQINEDRDALRGQPIQRADLRIGDQVDYWEGEVLERQGWTLKGGEYWGPWSDYGLGEDAHFRLIERPAPPAPRKLWLKMLEREARRVQTAVNDDLRRHGFPSPLPNSLDLFAKGAVYGAQQALQVPSGDIDAAAVELLVCGAWERNAAWTLAARRDRLFLQKRETVVAIFAAAGFTEAPEEERK